MALYTLSDFGAVSLMRYPTFTWVIYQQYQTAFDRSIAGVLSLALVGMALAIVLARLVYAREAAVPSHRLRGVAQDRRSCGWDGGSGLRWHFVGVVVALALGIPAGVLLHWLVSGECLRGSRCFYFGAPR